MLRPDPARRAGRDRVRDRHHRRARAPALAPPRDARGRGRRGGPARRLPAPRPQRGPVYGRVRGGRGGGALWPLGGRPRVGRGGVAGRVPLDQRVLQRRLLRLLGLARGVPGGPGHARRRHGAHRRGRGGVPHARRARPCRPVAAGGAAAPALAPLAAGARDDGRAAPHRVGPVHGVRVGRHVRRDAAVGARRERPVHERDRADGRVQHGRLRRRHRRDQLPHGPPHVRRRQPGLDGGRGEDDDGRAHRPPRVVPDAGGHDDLGVGADGPRGDGPAGGRPVRGRHVRDDGRRVRPDRDRDPGRPPGAGPRAGS